MQEIKVSAYNYFLRALEEKLSLVSASLADLHDSATGETKRTAGDKHETALAMVQIEQANKQKQKDELLAQKAVMQKIDPSIHTVSIVQGSLVKTSQHYFFISAALGKMNLNEDNIFAISPQSPLGQKMMGLKKGDQFSFNQTHYNIEEIY